MLGVRTTVVLCVDTRVLGVVVVPVSRRSILDRVELLEGQRVLLGGLLVANLVHALLGGLHRRRGLVDLLVDFGELDLLRNQLGLLHKRALAELRLMVRLLERRQLLRGRRGPRLRPVRRGSLGLLEQLLRLVRQRHLVLARKFREGAPQAREALGHDVVEH